METTRINISTFSFDDCFDLDMALTMPELNSDEDDGVAENSRADEEERDLLVSEMAMVCDPVGECAVCMEGFQTDVGSMAKRTRCGHVYHAHCITKWLSTRQSCPLCRSQITGHRES
ncbi:RING-H2 finger protein ATL66-like [Impatiens glandulifera]|uniref:RING-H2 finger protein ATL66-like n=1 Tax=Impatiens glandulifera TaxID=253017 RepID=UPI001FB0C71A|nr:RING-H2 finger protein ATL66-like [Impatiens glandulifera]